MSLHVMTPAEISARGTELFRKASRGIWRIADFASAPASGATPAIDKVKVKPIQHTALGSLKREDGEFIVFLHENWPRIQEALTRLDALERTHELSEVAGA
jgi:hypothetical protein